MSDLDPNFRKFERNRDYDNVTDSVEYVNLGKESYDNIFKEAAIINATVRQLNFTIDAIDKNPSKFVKGSEGFEFALAAVTFGINALPKMKESASKILNGLTSLNPVNDFSGLDATKAPKAVDGISQTKSNLENAVAEMDKLIGKIGKLETQFK